MERLAGNRPAWDSAGMRAMNRKSRWRVETSREEARALAASLRISPVVAQIMLNRGVGGLLEGGEAREAQCRDFLRPSLKTLHEPATLPGLTSACERLARAVRDKEPI